MGFLDRLKFLNFSEENKSTLQKTIEKHFPDRDESSYISYTCIAGLMARVAYADLKIEEKEEVYLSEALEKWTDLSHKDALAITEIAITNVKNLVGIENHFYCSPLVEIFNEAKRYALILALFQLAASDGEMATIESEEIRQINKYLRLTHQHFIAARAEVQKNLSQ